MSDLVAKEPARQDRRVAPGALHRMYETRRILLSAMGERRPTSMILAGLLALTLMSILLSLAWVQRSDIDYLKSSSGVEMLDGMRWTLKYPGQDDRLVTLTDLGTTSVKELAGEAFELTTEIPAPRLGEFMTEAGDASVVLVLPAIEYERMDVTSSWMAPRTLLRGEQSILVFNDSQTGGVESFTLHLKVWPHNTQERIIRSTVNLVPTFVAVNARYQKYQDFVVGRRTGSGKQLSDIGRIVLALFAIFLFIFIDSSAECLGLGIFMSLKALGVVVAQGWLPDGMFAATTMHHARDFLLSYADFMQLYFFTQLSRLWRPRPMSWLVAGVAFAAVYAFGTSVTPEAGGVNWPFQVWKWRNIGIGVACLACSLPVAIICLRAKLYHRTTALLVASSGVIVQIITPLIVDIPGVTESNWYKTWYNLFEMHTPYMFALSTFINVSTLERRVKTLSRAAIRKEAIERELVLGKAVQDAFFKIPELPAGLKMTYAHEAAEFVSGDVLFSHWDSVHNSVTMLLCDVTGHGVQAALKASICSAMSAAIWEDGQLRPGDLPSQRLEIFHRRVTAYLTKTSGSAEILAVVGAELDLDTGAIRLYRANGLFPIVVSRIEGVWSVKTRAHGSTLFDIVQPGEAAFVILASDGVIAGPRVMKHLLWYIDAELSSSGPLDAQNLKEIIHSFPGFRETGDDKTLAILDLQKFRPGVLQLPIAG